MSHLERLGNKFPVDLEPDHEGYVGRECPDEKCEGYFKIKPGTGNAENKKCCCPYCGEKGEQSDFTTRDQVEYVKSVAMRKMGDALFKDLKSGEFGTRGGFLNLPMIVKRGVLAPIYKYREKTLETQVTCGACGLDYVVYGVFACCPDCGEKNTLKVLHADHEIILKTLSLAEDVEAPLGKKLIENALEDCVSGFDAFGRNALRLAGKRMVSFQNIHGARKTILDRLAFDMADGIEPDDWNLTVRCFQKRHLISHKMGVIDDEYIKKSEDTFAKVGRKITIDTKEIKQLIPVLKQLALNLHNMP